MGPSNSAGMNERLSTRRGKQNEIETIYVTSLPLSQIIVKKFRRLLSLDLTNASRTNSVAGLPPSPNPSDGTTSVGQSRKWHKTSIGGMIRNASSISEKGSKKEAYIMDNFRIVQLYRSQSNIYLSFFSADSISLSGVSTGTELEVRFSGDGSLANVGITQSSISEYSPELNSHLEGCLATEASMVVLDTLELIVQV